MANSDKNIVITPNTGTSSYPSIAFTGSNASPITLKVLDTGALSFSATAGQLFTIQDGLTGSLFAVADISGIPLVEVMDTSIVKLNQYGGSTVIAGSSAIQNTGGINSKLSIYTNTATTTGLIVKGVTGQTANTVEFWQTPSTLALQIQQGTYPVYINNLSVGSNVYSNYQIVGGAIQGNMGNFLHQFSSWNTSWVTVGVKSVASQTGDIQQWLNSAGTVIAKVNSTGNVFSWNNFESLQSDIYVKDTAGTAFRSVRANAWSDSVDTRFFQVGSSNDNVAFTTGLGNMANRMQFSSSYTSVANIVYNGFSMPSAVFSVVNGNAAVTSVIIRAASSQTANLQEWQNSGGTALAKISAYGDLIIPDARMALGSSSLLANTFMFANTPYASYTPIVVRGAASQTADLQQWQNSGGSVLSRVASNGVIKANVGLVAENSIYGNYTALQVNSYVASGAGLIIAGASGQTANLQEWQNSSGTVLAKVDASGNVNTTKSFVQTGTIGTTYAIDASGNQAAYAANATVDFPNFSGMILIDCQTDGALSLWLCGGAAATRIGGSKTGGYDGNVAYNSGINGYTWTNANTSQNVNITAIRARSGA